MYAHHLGRAVFRVAIVVSFAQIEKFGWAKVCIAKLKLQLATTIFQSKVGKYEQLCLALENVGVGHRCYAGVAEVKEYILVCIFGVGEKFTSYNSKKFVVFSCCRLKSNISRNFRFIIFSEFPWNFTSAYINVNVHTYLLK